MHFWLANKERFCSQNSSRELESTLCLKGFAQRSQKWISKNQMFTTNLGDFNYQVRQQPSCYVACSCFLLQQKRRITTCTSQSWNKHHHIKLLHSCHNTTSCKTHSITITIKLAFRNIMSTQIVWTPKQTTLKKQKHAGCKKHKLLQQLTCKKTIPPDLWYLQGQLPTSSSLRLEGNQIFARFLRMFGWTFERTPARISISRRKPRNLVSVLVLYSSCT